MTLEAVSLDNIAGALCGRPVARALKEIVRFHGAPALGVVIGAIMADWTMTLIGPMVESDAIVETERCLPGAVQLFTPMQAGKRLTMGDRLGPHPKLHDGRGPAGPLGLIIVYLAISGLSVVVTPAFLSSMKKTDTVQPS